MCIWTRHDGGVQYEFMALAGMQVFLLLAQHSARLAVSQTIVELTFGHERADTVLLMHNIYTEIRRDDIYDYLTNIPTML
jgi:hypothetical protein